ncbi:hypothetical protein Efla_007548 [Eimeria flavescens]
MSMRPEFAEFARPLVDLTKKGQPFIWEAKHTAAVRALKHRLINYTVLQIPDPANPFVLKLDASGCAIGAVLEQDGKPLGFLSKKMREFEQRYAIYDQELLALVTALERWRRLLLHVEVTVYRDQRVLQYLLHLKGHKPVRSRVARWLEYLADFGRLTTKYKLGSEKMLLSLTESHQVETPQGSYHKLTTLQQQAQETKWVEPFGLRLAKSLRILETYLKQQLRCQISRLPTYVQSCRRCRQAKYVSAKPQGLLQSLRIPNRRWATVSLDFIMGLPKTARTNEAILTSVDSLSKVAHFVPTETTVTAQAAVVLFAERLIRYHWLPEKFISDRYPKFVVADLWGERMQCARNEIDHLERDNST